MLRVIVSSSYCLTFKFLKSATYSSSLPPQAYLLEVLVTPALGVTGFALPVLFLIIVYFKIILVLLVLNKLCDKKTNSINLN